MKCPLKRREQFYGSLPLPDIDDSCLKEDCAWWDMTAQQCSELTKARRLDLIAAKLTEIESKMPHESQFRK